MPCDLIETDEKSFCTRNVCRAFHSTPVHVRVPVREIIKGRRRLVPQIILIIIIWNNVKKKEKKNVTVLIIL